ncbi:MAG: hypothetical protein MUE85_01740 [Microscillaceae bacterium]|jgi:hypothetical protein|nr:hypothetical protein [Microscillaceae bacterium]
MLEFLSTILFIRTFTFLFSTKSADNQGFSYVLAFIAGMMALGIMGVGFDLWNDFQGNRLANRTFDQWLNTIGIAGFLAFISYGTWQASMILPKANPLRYNELQEFQIYQSIARSFNIMFGVVMVFVAINAVMMFLLLIGVVIFLVIVLATLGLVLLNKDFKFDAFVSVPSAFFKAEKDYFAWVGIDVAWIVLICGIVIFIIPAILGWWVVIRQKVLLD